MHHQTQDHTLKRIHKGLTSAPPPSLTRNYVNSQSGDVERVAKATGAKVQTTVNNLDKAALGHCATFEEKQVSKRPVWVDVETRPKHVTADGDMLSHSFPTTSPNLASRQSQHTVHKIASQPTVIADIISPLVHSRLTWSVTELATGQTCMLSPVKIAG